MLKDEKKKKKTKAEKINYKKTLGENYKMAIFSNQVYYI